MSSTIFYYDKLQVKGPMLHDRHMQVFIESAHHHLSTFIIIIIIIIMKK